MPTWQNPKNQPATLTKKIEFDAKKHQTRRANADYSYTNRFFSALDAQQHVDAIMHRF
jgi:hypothetical protein